MTRVRFISADGEVQDIDANDGISVMETAVRAGIDGIDADCGGACSCATCHIYIDDAWMSRVPEPEAVEEEMLDFVQDRQPESRLSCQVVLGPDLDGLTVRIPATQR